jgi:cytochrome c oxidase subunit 3
MSVKPAERGPARSRPFLTRVGLLSSLSVGLLGTAALMTVFTGRRRQPTVEFSPAGTPPVLTPDQRPGAKGAGGLFAIWPAASEDGATAEHIEYQYSGIGHQRESALSGMWLFLTTEVLFFGALFLLYMIYRHFHPDGFAVASNHSRLAIGTINTVLLVTSSAVFSSGLGCIRGGDNRMLGRACLMTGALGTAFLLLKAYEWKLDFDDNLFPGPHFAITGDDAGGAQLFWSFYFVATGLHGLHMIVGIGLVGWIAWAARRRRFSAGYHAPVEVVGLYWSFVDMVWLCLYPMIYLVHRGAS